MLLSIQSISQEKKNESRDVEEIKLIMNDIFNNIIYTGDFYFKESTYILPSYFNSYIDYYKMLKNYMKSKVNKFKRKWTLKYAKQINFLKDIDILLN